MRVLAVNGSPRESGICRSVLTRVLDGARNAGAEIELVSLSNKNLKPCRACEDAKCWSNMECKLEDDALALRRALNECDGFVFVAPVYFLSVNGLAKDFIDRMRNYRQDTRPSVAISVAGGTGKGCMAALQEICRWIMLIGFCPVVAEPVTRYNLDLTMGRAVYWGKTLVDNISKVKQRGGLYDKLLAFESLPYMNYTIVDEILYLARSAIEAISRRGVVEQTAELAITLERAESALRLGRMEEGIKLAVEAHERSMYLFNKIGDDDG